MKISEIRRERLRELMEKHGATKLANALGYHQPSFLSQMAGPNPSREITEKTARKYERALGLPVDYLDTPLETDATMQAQLAHNGQRPAKMLADATVVADIIRLVGSICDGESVTLPTMKFADVVALAYLDTVEHGSTPRPEHIQQIVRLLK